MMRFLHDRRPADLLLGAAAVLAAVAVVVLIAVRLRYGVDFEDEAYYAALAYRFVLGDRPFVDEMNLLQLPALMTYPLVKAYVSVAGGTTGLILFMRVMWLLFYAGIATAGFLFLRTLMRWPVALVASLLPLVAAPFNVPTLSYNSMSAGFLGLGMLLGAWATVRGRGLGWLLAAGVLHGLAAWAYPTLSLALFGFAAALLVLYRRDAFRPVLAYLSGATVVGALLGVFLLLSGIGNVVEAWRYMSRLSGYAGGTHKLLWAGGQAARFFLHQPLFVAALALAVGGFLLFRDRGRWVFLLPVAAMFPIRGVHDPYTPALFAVTMYGLVGVALGLAAKGRPQAWRLYVWGVLPSFAAALVTTYTSTNGFLNAAIGFFPALLATGGVLVLVVQGTETRGRTAGLLSWVLIGLFTLTVAWFGRSQYHAVYHDAAVKYLSVTVPAGPFAGLRTTAFNATFDAQLRSDVARYVRPGSRVMFFDDFPAGYLYSTARPGANTLWLSASDNKFRETWHPTLLWWRRTGEYPDVAFRYLYRVPYDSPHTLRAYVSPPRYRLEVERPRYEVWVREQG